MTASQKLTNCCVAEIAFHCFDLRLYTSLLDRQAPCIWRILLGYPIICFLTKASQMAFDKEEMEWLTRNCSQ
jgi:hypothetical protein